MSKLLQRLNDASRSGVYRAARTDEILDATRGSGLQVSRIGLSGAAGKEALMERLARALEFPRWFGGNWDALEDCLSDLSWREAPGWVLILRELDGLPRDDRGVLIEVLASAAQFWAERGKLFFAVFIDPQRLLALPDLYKEK